MRRVLRSLIVVALLTVVGATGASALTPDDAIRLSRDNVDDRTIIAKICSDGDAWDLSSDDIVYLRDQGVSDAVIQALMDPEGAAERYGFTAGEGGSATDEDTEGEYAEAGDYAATPYVFSLGYYYGPLSRFYYCDPFFYDYLYSPGFSFSYSSWPSFYASFCWPYDYGFYAYPYFWYPYGSFYYGYAYCGPRYSHYYGGPRPGAGRYYYGDARWRHRPRDGSSFSTLARRRFLGRDPSRLVGRGGPNPRAREWARVIGRTVGRDRAAVRDPSQTQHLGQGSRVFARRGEGGNSPRYGQRTGGFRMRQPESGTLRAPQWGGERQPYRVRAYEPQQGYEPQRGYLRRPEWGSGGGAPRQYVQPPQRVEARQPAREGGSWGEGRAWSGGRAEQPPARGGGEMRGGGRGGDRGRH